MGGRDDWMPFKLDRGELFARFERPNPTRSRGLDTTLGTQAVAVTVTVDSETRTSMELCTYCQVAVRTRTWSADICHFAVDLAGLLPRKQLSDHGHVGRHSIIATVLDCCPLVASAVAVAKGVLCIVLLWTPVVHYVFRPSIGSYPNKVAAPRPSEGSYPKTVEQHRTLSQFTGFRVRIQI